MVESIAEVIIKSIFMTIFIVLAICGNLLVCIAIKTNTRLRTLTNYYVFNLAVADFLFGITGMPLILVTTIARRWVLGPALCQISGTLNTLFVLVSIWTLTLISVNRYFAVGRATSYKSIYRKNRVLVSIVCVWILAALMAIAPQFGWSQIVKGDNFCTINGRKHISYSGIVITFAYIAPLIILICLYMKIFHVLKTHEKSMAAMRNGSMVARGYSEADFDTGSVDYSDSMKVKTSSLQRENRRENIPHADDGNGKSFNNEPGGLVLNTTALSYQDGGTVDSENNVDVRNHSSHIPQQTKPSGEIVNQDAVEIELANDTNAEAKYTRETSVNATTTTTTTPSRGLRPGSDSKVKLIIEANGEAAAASYSKDECTVDEAKTKHRVRTISGLAQTMKIKRTRTSKKIKKFIMEARITKMLFVVVAFFFISWTPLVVGTILYAFNAEPKNFNMLSMGFVIACMNSICNPIIYAFMNKLFRRTFKEIFQKLASNCRSCFRGEENSKNES